MSIIVAAGTIRRTLITWELTEEPPDHARLSRALVELLPHLSIDARDIINEVSQMQLSTDTQHAVLEVVLRGVRATVMATGNGMAAQRVDLALAEVKASRRAHRQHHLWVVRGDERIRVGVVEQAPLERTWWGTFTGALGGTTLGPHEEPTADELIERMARRACGLPDTYQPPPIVPDELLEAPPVGATVLELVKGGRS